MKDENLALGSKFAKNFNKKYGVVTYSGTLAIEIALQSLGLKQKAKILVSSNVCYSIINTIIKLNMVPVIKLPQNNLFLTDSDIKEVFTKQRIDCILLVHQFGLFNNIDILMYKNMGIKISLHCIEKSYIIPFKTAFKSLIFINDIVHIIYIKRSLCIL